MKATRAKEAKSALSAGAEQQSRGGRGLGTHWLWGSRAPRRRCCPRRWGRWTTPAGWRALQSNTNPAETPRLSAPILLHTPAVPAGLEQHHTHPPHTGAFSGAATPNAWLCSWPDPRHRLPEKLPLKENRDVKMDMVVHLKPANISRFTSFYFLPQEMSLASQIVININWQLCSKSLQATSPKPEPGHKYNVLFHWYVMLAWAFCDSLPVYC